MDASPGLIALQRAEREASESAALLDTLFTEAPIGAAFFDRNLRYLRINDSLAEINGLPAHEHIGRTVAEVLPGLDDVTAIVEGVLTTGDAVRGVEVKGETPGLPGQRRTFHSSWYPVRHRGGEIFAVGVIVVELTDRVHLLEAERAARARAEAAERRSAFLARTGELFAESLDWEETLRRVARVAVPAKADLCAVDLMGADSRLERLVVAHHEPEREEVAVELDRRWPIGDNLYDGMRRVLAGDSVLFEEVPEAVTRAVAQSEEHLVLLERLSVSSGMSVPLRVRGQVVGALTFAMAGSGRRFGQEDLVLAEGVARLASMAIESARLYRERDHIAQTLQQSLLPPRLPDVPGFEIAGRYRAAGEAYDVGGDFYDVFPSGDGRWTAIVGDVCGKGPEAAALTALARYTVRAGALVSREPSEVLTLLNDAILRERRDGRFLTAIAAQLRGDGLTSIDVVAAGHPPGLVWRAADGAVEPLGRPGRVLGIHGELMLQQVTTQLDPGDVVLLFTDGVMDAGAPRRFFDHDEIGRVMAATAARGAAETAGAVEARAVELAGGRPRDDIALIALRRTG